VKAFLKFITKRLLRISRRLLILCLLLAVIKTPWVLHFKVDANSLLNNTAKEEIMTRRAYLLSRLKNGSLDPNNMPKAIGAFFQGEWALGTCSMLAAALTNIAFIYPETRKESVQALDSLSKIVLQENFRHFDIVKWREDPIKSLASDNGHIGYLGHVSIILAARRILGGDQKYDSLLIKINEAISRRIMNNPFPYLETYPNEIYTADNLVIYAGLKLYDKIFEKDHSSLYENFRNYTENNLMDPLTGLLTFNVSSSGHRISSSRGSGVGWNSFYLPFFDSNFASRQYKLAKTEMTGNFPFGLKAFREYPRGVSGFGDIDSGPVILGMSTSGTGFIVAGARHAKDTDFLNGLLLTAEVVGTTVQWNGKRRYFFAPLVGDAIMLAMKTATNWDTRYLNSVDKNYLGSFSTKS